MPNLATSLRAFEPDQLQQIAILWGLEPTQEDKPSLLLTLELHIPQAEHFSSAFDQLSESAQQALSALKNNDGKLPWSTFAQRFGEIRALGKSLRKKEQPWAFPATISETLWYHGLLGRDFLRVEDDLNEMAYLPDELIPLVPLLPDQPAKLTLTALSPDLVVGINQAGSEILDEACLLLAALRFEKPQDYLAKTTVLPLKWNLLEALLLGTGVLDHQKLPTDLARKFLELPRALALKWLTSQWLKSSSFHEIHFLPDLQIEATSPIRSQAARQTIVDLLSQLQAECWYSLDDFIDLLKSTEPDFLREQEEYFSWTILKDGNLQELLSGYESWLQVEGALVAFIVLQMLPGLALADTATQKDLPSQKLFRLKQNFFSLDSSSADLQEEPEDGPINLTSTGKIVMTDRSPRLVRYQISRFVEWQQVSPSSGTYQITPRSLSKAKEQGLLPRHLIQLLRKHAEGGLPPILYEAIKRWEAEGTQASIQTQTILRLGSPEILQALRESPAAHWLGESLGPTTVIIKPAGEKAILQALSGLGYLSDYNESESKNA